MIKDRFDKKKTGVFAFYKVWKIHLKNSTHPKNKNEEKRKEESFKSNTETILCLQLFCILIFNDIPNSKKDYVFHSTGKLQAIEKGSSWSSSFKYEQWQSHCYT